MNHPFIAGVLGGCMAAFLLTTSPACAARRDYHINFDESKVPAYVLPDPLTLADGTKVTTTSAWKNKRRKELVTLLSDQEYGRTPSGKIAVSYAVVREVPNALNGKAVQRQVRFTFTGNGRQVQALLLLYIPKNREGKVPVIVSYNFKGNHSIQTDPNILYSPGFEIAIPKDNPDWARGSQYDRWPVEKIIDRGYALATMCYHDIFPDSPEFRDRSIQALFPDYETAKTRSDFWGAIGAWAWGSSRIADYLYTQKWVDRNRIALTGHSRQGKAALWAGAQDERFKLIIANNSGCSGDALSKRVFGENIYAITSAFPHWFCKNYNQYQQNEASLPFDQHELIALMAPRPVMLTSSSLDRWADPKGQFLSAQAASPVYELFGLKGLTGYAMPPLHEPIMNDVGYYIKHGIHSVTNYDWDNYLDFCDLHFYK